MVRQFGHTWWGEAWLEALENRVLRDPNRLPRGRTYARQDRVQRLELEPGLLRAEVTGTDVYVTSLGVRPLDPEQWDTLIENVVSQAKQAAELMSGEVPRSLGPVLLPGSGELTPSCSCPDGAEPCKHAAALCYVASDLFDADPFALLLLRGRGREQVLREIRRRRAAALGTAEPEAIDTNRPRGTDPGTPASAAYRRAPTPVERAMVAPAVPGRLPALVPEPPADAGIDGGELDRLVADAARRAHAMLVHGAPSQLDLTVGADVARLAGHGDMDSIAERTKLPVAELAAAAAAFRHGGTAGIAAARQRWDADAATLAPGVRALGPMVAGGASPKTRANTVSVGSIQLRVDHDGQWWRFEADDDLGWLLVAPPSNDPDDLMQ